MKTIALAFSLFITTLSFGQITGFSVRVGPNLPLIPTETNSTSHASGVPYMPGATIHTTNSSIRNSYQSHLGFYAGGQVHYKITKRVVVSPGLSISSYRWKQEQNVLLQENAITLDPTLNYPFNILGESQSIVNFQGEDHGKTTAYFVQVPIMAGIKFFNDKLILEAGTVFALTAKVYQRRTELRYNGLLTFGIDPVESVDPPTRFHPLDFEFNEVRKDVTGEFSKYNLGGIFRAGYQLSRRFQLGLSLQKNFTPMKEDSKISSGRLNSASFDITYLFKKTSPL